MKRLLIISLCTALTFLSCKNEENPVYETEQESISTPQTPTGPSTGNVDETLSFSTSGAESNLSHDLEYQYYWGDFEYSNWSSSNSASHSWSGTGTMFVKARARCEEHTDIVSEWSNAKQVIISQASHTVSTPNTPSGPDSGEVDESLSFSTGGATCNQGHSVQYRFSWGDGTYSNWSSSTTAAHSWSDSGAKYVKAQARCSQNTAIVSNWSNTKTVEIAYGVHEVIYPDQPSGPENGYIGATYTFTASGSSCSHGHSVQYRFSWGTGDLSPWSDSNTATHSWDSPGGFYIGAQARCAEDTSIVSSWSLSMLLIHIEDQECDFNVTNPYQGDVWQNGESQTIEWDSNSACGSYVKIELYESSNYICEITSSTYNSGSYQWTVTDCGNGELNSYRIKVTSLSTNVYDLSWYFAIQSNSGVVELSATKDAYVSNGHPDNNYGYSDWLVVGVNNHEYWSYLQFDLTSIPSNATVESAELVLQRFLKVGSFDMLVKMVGESWSEGTVTWNNTPIPYTFPFSVIDATEGGNSLERYTIEVDVTEHVQLWISGERINNGFWLWFTPSTLPNGNEVDFGSRNNDDDAYKPKLRVTYSE